jgi:BirA family biotin operon repressor/biotin-[acetyl-CoA-carboxylase] ligase
VSAFEEHRVWPDALESVVESLGGFDRVIVLEETGSTQDFARQEGPRPGTVVVTARQTAGRGRHGRHWSDEAGAGVAMSLVLPAGCTRRLCAQAAVAVAQVLVPLFAAHGLHSGIKWPNDFYVVTPNGRHKIAGVLIEQSNGVAVVGIGVNVHRRNWSGELSSIASSLAEHGIEVTRLDLQKKLIVAFDAAMNLGDMDLARIFRDFDLIAGGSVVLDHEGQRLQGLVKTLDPVNGLLLETASGEKVIDSDRVHLIDW